MSLFASSFDKGLSSGPSRQLTNQKQPGSGKRKRPSAGGAGQDDQIKSTQVNLEKLMSKIGQGELKEKRVGRESIGLGAGSGSGKRARNNKDKDVKGFHHFDDERSTPKPKSNFNGNKEFKGKGKGSTQSPAAGNSSKSTFKFDKNDKMDKGNKADGKSPSTSKTQKVDKAKQAPAEIPMPSFTVDKSGKAGDDAAFKVGGQGTLTDMQKNMQAKLEGARFRWINEQLYSTPSTEAVAMMKKDPKIFADYHMTHRLLTAGWPQPPLQHIIKTLAPLPAGTVIADLGCGDAGLARALVPQGKIVLSYDLVGDSGVPGSTLSTAAEEGKSQFGGGSGGWVVEADFLEKVPLPGRPGGSDYVPSPSNVWNPNKKAQGKGKGKGRDAHANANASEVVDVVVCCLSLMGKNWVGGIAEACRILKQGGTFNVAEVTSRFVDSDKFVEKIESFGFKLEDKEEPSTHFTLYTFIKMYEVPLGPARGQKGWEERVEEGEEILRGCVYKKR